MKEKIKKILRFFNLLIAKPRDSEKVKELKTKFIHKERSFMYGCIKYLVDSLYCHAAPGVVETVILELENIKKNNGVNENKLLNMGGGNGEVSSMYKSVGFDVCNLDIDIMSSSDNKNVRFDLNQDTPIPLEENTFDVIVCQEIIEHIENPWKFFRNAQKLLKNDGVLIVSTPNILSLQSRIMFLFSGYFKWFTPECFNYHVNPIPAWEIKLLADRNNFNIYMMKGNGDYFFNRNNENYKSILRNNETLIFFLKSKSN